jgi:hypothetical protein
MIMLMDNQQLPPAPPPMMPTGPANPYDFLQNNPVPKKSLLPGGNSKIGRLIIALVIFVVLVIVGIIVMNILSAPNRALVNDMVLAAQQQNELIRVADIGIKDAVSPDTKNLAINTKLTLETDQRKLKAVVDKSKNLDEKTLALGRDDATDKTLTSAKQTNSFDEVFTKLLQKELQEYQLTLKRVHDNASNQTTKQVFAEQYSHAKLLLETVK